MPVSPRMRAYMLSVLALIYVFNGVDRSIMWVVLEPIKHDLHLTDTQLGALSGFAFGVFYAIAGIPIGILADRIERRRIVALAVGIWSVMTASCGLTTSFWQLFAARVAVGTAESGGPPASISLITDLYPRGSRAAAIALYMSGSSVALVLTYAMGSWVASRWGWRTGFLAAGVPGLVLALLVWTTFREPPRGGTDDAPAEARPATFRATLKLLMTKVPIRWMLSALASTQAAAVGLATFMLSFLIRSHHMTLTRAGALIALGHLFAALTIVIVGRIADRLTMRDERWTVWLPAVIAGVGLPLTLVLTLTDNPIVVYIALPLVSAVPGSQVGPVFAFLQNNVQPTMRATTLSIAYVIQNLIGIGAGSLLVGTLSDRLSAGFGAESLRYAMACVAVLYTVAALCYLRAAHSLHSEARFAAAGPTAG